MTQSKQHGERVFVGILLHRTEQVRLARWQQDVPDIPRVRWKHSDKLHLTLFFLERCSPDELAKLTETAQRVARRTRRFSLTLRPQPTWFRGKGSRAPHIFYAQPVPVRPLITLHKAIRSGVRMFLPRVHVEEQFVPHITLGKSKTIFQTGHLSPLPSLVLSVNTLAVVLTQQGPTHDRYRLWKRIPLA